MLIKIDDLTGDDVIGLLNEHLRGMSQNSPPESVHSLNIAELQKPEITFWSAWEEMNLVGCGALKELDKLNSEVGAFILDILKVGARHLLPFLLSAI